MDSGNILFAFAITTAAGLSTAIGGFIAFFSRRQSAGFLSSMLGFSAGVMIYVSMIEIFPKAQDALTADLGDRMGTWVTVLGFFGGIALIAFIDKVVPSEMNPHEITNATTGIDVKQRARLMRMGLLTATAIAIHNFPEGFATFLSTVNDPEVGIPIAIAIGLHNIPEGIAVSVPIFYATGSRRKAFWLTAASGLAEPLGALVGFLVLTTFVSDTLMGMSLAAVAGIMIFISVDELLPSAEEFGKHHIAIYSMVAGMGVMALSLLLMM
ncbi:zinc transporter ZupT [Flaviflexus salsibiostraticola]|uniref:Zinc transporter ZupT n=1 Tax=Flaviflexus salsibiostraticola TaxID=1282737 RepID=A0A3S8ZBG2_9ACTO|nr:zinc transporter ZupT [Flaviflexus salsibiostraticola]AZN30806.1 zinc transporter ZupT [Flaviflexus salsibiostraticola]